MGKKREIMETSLMVVCGLFLIIYSIITKNYKALIVIIIIFTLIFLVYLYIAFSSKKDKKHLRTLKEQYLEIKEKDNKSIFEQCYVSIFQEKMDIIIKEEIKKNKIKEVSSIGSDIVNKNKIEFIYRYRGFDVIITIENNHLSYLIDSSVKYAGQKSNQDIEKIKNVNYDLNEYKTLSDFISLLCTLIKSINDEINNYSEVNPVDQLFNGRLNNKLDAFSKYLKREGLVCVILGLPSSIFMFFGFVMVFVDTNYRTENLIGFILALVLCPAFGLLILYGFIRGIIFLIKRSDCKKDIKLKRTKKIKAKPTKIRIVKEHEKYDTYTTIQYVNLYFKNVKLVIPLSYAYLVNKKNIHKFYEKCLEIDDELTYLTKSKIVIAGEKRYIKLLERYLLK